MTVFSGDFEIHITGSEWQADELAAFAAQRGVKFTHIHLHRGDQWSQPMITLSASGTDTRSQDLAARWRADMMAEGLHVIRVKIEAAPWNEGVPRSDEDAPGDLYFEHHVKVRLPNDIRRYGQLLDAAKGVGAHVSANARRQHGDSEERFVTQRCHNVGLPTAHARLGLLVEALRTAKFEVLEVEEEYVVHDSAIEIDHGWLTDAPARTTRADRFRAAPAGVPGFPSTYQPVPVKPGEDITQHGVFDPGLKQFPNAFRHGQPVFGDPSTGERWLAARRAAMSHLLAVIADSPWAPNLVLRGSVVLRAWLGEAAREPGDVDFVVVPRGLVSKGELLPGVVDAVAANPGAGLLARDVVSEDIWTYDRVPGRRLVFPFQVDDLPRGAIQLDFVFNEPMPEPPVAYPPDPRLRAASPGLSLAWKLMWLVSDWYPQGKDLYDAVLLAEYTKVSPDLVREVLGHELDVAELLSLHVDWANFQAEYPGTPGNAATWLQRLVAALS